MNQSFTDNLEYVGVDKLWITFPIDQDNSDETAAILTSKGFLTSSLGFPLRWAKGTVYVGNAPIHVKVFNNGRSAQLRFNPSRLIDSVGKTLCKPEDCADTIFWLLRYLKYVCIPAWAVDTKTGQLFRKRSEWPKDWEKQITIQRVDIARDFKSNIDAFDVSCLVPIRKKNFPKDYIHRNSGTVETITWGSSTRARMIFYNKSKAHDLEKGWFRFEVQARTNYLKEVGVENLQDITSTKLFKELEERWKQSCFDSVLSLGGGLHEFYAEMVDKFSPEAAINFLGIATAMEKGLDTKLHSRTISKYRKMGSALGFNLGADLGTLGLFKVRLDLSSGQIVAT